MNQSTPSVTAVHIWTMISRLSGKRIIEIHYYPTRVAHRRQDFDFKGSTVEEAKEYVKEKWAATGFIEEKPYYESSTATTYKAVWD